VKLRFPARRTDHEMELGVIIGKPASNIKLEDALNYVAGYCIALDMVVRGSQDRSMRKSVDTYGVAGPWMVTADEIADPQNLDFSLAVNGEVKQKSNTKNMIMDLKRQIQFGAEYYTLLPGDIIMSGTCSGVSQVKPGDVMHCEIEKIGAMDVRIGAAD
jgi:2-keto-4-pentenoate hydratase/2-oxohepta-3-ene-1,7-dioic acid hydratase in catechol pathway